jgi:hypothetical protein
MRPHYLLYLYIPNCKSLRPKGVLENGILHHILEKQQHAEALPSPMDLFSFAQCFPISNILWIEFFVWSVSISMYLLNKQFLVFTWRYRRHVGVPWTKDFSLASIVRDTNMGAMSLSFYSLRNEWKPRILNRMVMHMFFSQAKEA